MVRLFRENNCFLAASTLVNALVLSNRRITNFSRTDKQLSDTSDGIADNSANAAVASGKQSQVFHADFFTSANKR